MVGSLAGAVLLLQVARRGLLGGRRGSFRRRRGSFRGRRGTLRWVVALRRPVLDRRTVAPRTHLGPRVPCRRMAHLFLNSRGWSRRKRSGARWSWKVRRLPLRPRPHLPCSLRLTPVHLSVLARENVVGHPGRPGDPRCNRPYANSICAPVHARDIFRAAV